MDERARLAFLDQATRAGLGDEEGTFHIEVEDGRSYVRRSKEKFQVIQATLVDTWASTAAGAFALPQTDLLHNYIGTGVVPLSVTFQAGAAATNTVGLTDIIGGSFNGYETITYDYTPASSGTPEPATLFSAATALMGLVFAKRRLHKARSRS